VLRGGCGGGAAGEERLVAGQRQRLQRPAGAWRLCHHRLLLLAILRLPLPLCAGLCPRCRTSGVQLLLLQLLLLLLLRALRLLPRLLVHSSRCRAGRPKQPALPLHRTTRLHLHAGHRSRCGGSRRHRTSRPARCGPAHSSTRTAHAAASGLPRLRPLAMPRPTRGVCRRRCHWRCRVLPLLLRPGRPLQLPQQPLLRQARPHDVCRRLRPLAARLPRQPPCTCTLLHHHLPAHTYRPALAPSAPGASTCRHRAHQAVERVTTTTQRTTAAGAVGQWQRREGVCLRHGHHGVHAPATPWPGPGVAAAAAATVAAATQAAAAAVTAAAAGRCTASARGLPSACRRAARRGRTLHCHTTRAHGPRGARLLLTAAAACAA
jgi:hypothetical protein